MTFPEIDSRDYVFNPERSHPPTTPQVVWVVYYQGLDGSWIWSYPTFYYENAVKEVNTLNRPSRILEYQLTNETITNLFVEPRPEKVAKIIKKVRQVRG